MYIETCDLCGKTVEFEKSVKVGYRALMERYALCDNCGAPVLEFLKQHGLDGAKKELIKI